jgi:hypothetical protein
MTDSQGPLTAFELVKQSWLIHPDWTVEDHVSFMQWEVVSTTYTFDQVSMWLHQLRRTSPIAKHIREFFADMPVGSGAPIAEIAAYHSTVYPEGYDDDGAILSYLYGTHPRRTGTPGIEYAKVDGRNGARKVS